MNIDSQSIRNYNISFKGDEFMDYKVAQVSKEEIEAIKKAENLIKSETGKEFVMIAWEKIK